MKALGIVINVALLIFSITALAQANCVSEVTAHRAVEVKIESSGSCTKLNCTNVKARNIQAALAICHQTEKDFNFCGWHEKRRIKHVEMLQPKGGVYEVGIEKCHT
ncbi:hypothetical protein [Microbulbifer sp. YPW1]|uniref:hypothetical protein n=1 Tax=Microbulbifer sp. YPW1 TaxID=2745199 RepID=UPI00159A0C4B|nr:hypothetical protein [Microbulbifer sp. YPW1]QKX17749.1 hypothetical protein HUW35_12625 [Microbulbifer sp. YPW1]